MGKRVILGKKDLFDGMRPQRSRVGELDVVVLSLKKSIVVIENRCPHQQADIFHQALVEDGAITCPLHGRTFDLASGECRNGAGRITILKSGVEQGMLWAEAPEGPAFALF